MSLLLDWVTQPVGLISLLLVSTLLSRRWKFPGQWLPASTPGIAVGLFWLFSTPVIANSVVYLIENWRQNPELCDTQHNSRPLVVLGGGMDAYRQSTSAYELLDRDSQLRVNRAIEAATTGRTYSGNLAGNISPAHTAGSRCVRTARLRCMPYRCRHPVYRSGFSSEPAAIYYCLEQIHSGYA